MQSLFFLPTLYKICIAKHGNNQSTPTITNCYSSQNNADMSVRKLRSELVRNDILYTQDGSIWYLIQMRVNLKKIFVISSETAKRAVLSTYFTFFARAYSISTRWVGTAHSRWHDKSVFSWHGLRLHYSKVSKVQSSESSADTIQNVAWIRINDINHSIQLCHLLFSCYKVSSAFQPGF
jgi:hypothetical protein